MFCGTFTRENLASPSSSVSTARDRLRFDMNGKGCAGSNVKGVSVGRTVSSKYSRMLSCSGSGSSS